MMKPLSRRDRRLFFSLAIGGTFILCGWLATIPGQAEESPLEQVDSIRKPITCTDAAGILYERGTPGFERCLDEMEQAAGEQAAREATREKQRRIKKRVQPTPSPRSTQTD